MRDHVGREAAYLRSIGCRAADAEREARLRFGSTAMVREDARAARGWRWLDVTTADVCHAIRQVRRAPAMTLLAVATFAFAVGAATGGASLVYAALWKSLPFTEPDRLVLVSARVAGQPNGRQRFGYPAVLDLQRRVHGVAETAAVSPTGTFNLLWQRPGGPEPVAGSFVSPDLFSVLGVSAARGRVFTAADHQPAAVLSDRFWRSRFGSDASVIGQAMAFPASFTIVGVLPPEVRLDEDVDVWLAFEPQTFAAWGPDRRAFQVVARLAPGFTVAAFQDRIAAVEASPPLVAIDLRRALVGDVAPALWLLCGAVVCVVLLGCLNVSTLLLDRAIGRDREIAIRAALGATRGRIIAQLVAESAVLAGLGGTAGLVLTLWLQQSMLAQASSVLPHLVGTRAATVPVVAALAATTICALVAGLLPGTRLGRHIGHALSALQSTPRRDVQRLRRLLAVAQVSLALALLVATGLLVRSLANILVVDLGFRPDHVVAVQLSTDIEDPRARVAFLETLFERVRSLPGVVDVGASTRVPLREGGAARVQREGDAAAAEPLEVDLRRASRDYFVTLGIRTARGRTFNSDDRLGSPAVAVVNETAAGILWPARSALGQRLRIVRPGQEAPPVTVVGVVGDVRHDGPEVEPRAEVYLSLEQGPPFGPLLVMRTTGDPVPLSSAVRSAVSALSGETEVLGVVSLAQLLSERTAPRRSAVAILGVFGTFAVVLAFVGVYATVSQVMTGRRREMAVRMTLGASPRRILFAGLWDAGLYTLPGLAVGLIGGLAASSLLARWLFAVGVLDPLTLLIASGGVGVVVMLASLAPAVRAARLDPARVLRSE
jgi:predicted permease